MDTANWPVGTASATVVGNHINIEAQGSSPYDHSFALVFQPNIISLGESGSISTFELGDNIESANASLEGSEAPNRMFLRVSWNPNVSANCKFLASIKGFIYIVSYTFTKIN